MAIKIGSTSSDKGVEILSADATLEQIRAQFVGFLDTELFEAILMIEHLLLKIGANGSINRSWIARLEKHLHEIQNALSDNHRAHLMTKYGFKSVFEATHYGRSLLFPWFRL